MSKHNFRSEVRTTSSGDNLAGILISSRWTYPSHSQLWIRRTSDYCMSWRLYVEQWQRMTTDLLLSWHWCGSVYWTNVADNRAQSSSLWYAGGLLCSCRFATRQVALWSPDHESCLFVTSWCSHVWRLLLHRRLLCRTCCQYDGSAALDVVTVVWLLWLPAITIDSRFSRAISPFAWWARGSPSTVSIRRSSARRRRSHPDRQTVLNRRGTQPGRFFWHHGTRMRRLTDARQSAEAHSWPGSGRSTDMSESLSYQWQSDSHSLL